MSLLYVRHFIKNLIHLDILLISWTGEKLKYEMFCTNYFDNLFLRAPSVTYFNKWISNHRWYWWSIIHGTENNPFIWLYKYSLFLSSACFDCCVQCFFLNKGTCNLVSMLSYRTRHDQKFSHVHVFNVAHDSGTRHFCILCTCHCISV